MLKKLKESDRLKETGLLAAFCILCFSFSIFRYVYTDTKVFLFLNWNLFLAFLPWLFSSLIIIYPKFRKYWVVLLLLIFSWLLFFPNAPYILTDLFHLRLRSSMPVWFDLVLILAYAWTGLLFGMLSLWDIERILTEKLRPRLVSILSFFLIFLGSFGIYLGRFLRWNSWDIISKPYELFYDIGDRFINPFHHPRTWGMTLFMFVFLSMVYLSLKLVRKRII